MASCYAMYKTLFRMGYPFSYDLDDLGHYYVAYARLMNYWRALLPDRFLDLDYEALVADQEGTTRRLLEHCGLEWRDGLPALPREPRADGDRERGAGAPADLPRVARPVAQLPAGTRAARAACSRTTGSPVEWRILASPRAGAATASASAVPLDAAICGDATRSPST